jgi:hypothetical protein
MTQLQLLQKAFAEASKLPQDEQDLLATRLLAELLEDDGFDRAITDSADKLVPLAREAIADYRSGKTEELNPDQL